MTDAIQEEEARQERHKDAPWWHWPPLASLTEEQLLHEIADHNATVANIRGQIAAAEAQEAEGGPPVDRTWRKRAHFAAKKYGQRVNALQAHLGLLRSRQRQARADAAQARGAARRAYQRSVDRAFVNAAYEELEEEVFRRILERARAEVPDPRAALAQPVTPNPHP